jgi:hypothetical protein
MTKEFFKNLYNRDVEVKPEGILHLIQRKIDEDTNNKLCKDFTEEEISFAMFQIGPMKAAGLDGYPAHFFQQNWDIIK